MDIAVVWNQKMQFTAKSGSLECLMDAKAPLGDSAAMTPKELLLAGLGGCTAMDVAALMKKHQQPVKTFQVLVSVEASKSHPVVFTQGHLTYSLTGELAVERVIESVKLSKNQYCGVSAMLEKAFPITYEVVVNNKKVFDSRS